MNEWEWRLLEEKPQLDSISVDGITLKTGDRVLLRPHAGKDIFDLALTGQCAVIESIEQDYEGNAHLAVVLEDDPGKDMGILRQPGHRFFFTPQEVEPSPLLSPSPRLEQPKILVAGIGNIFLGDDGFGVEVVRQLALRTFPESVRIRDFGIRGYDLAYALLEGYDLTILVDACPRGGKPGTVYLIDPDRNGAFTTSEPFGLDAHTMNPVGVIRLAQSMGRVSDRILLVACEPDTLGGEQGQMGLSFSVSNAVGEAVNMVQNLIESALNVPRYSS